MTAHASYYFDGEVIGRWMCCSRLAGRFGASEWLSAVPAASALSVLPPITDAQTLHSVASGLISMACEAAAPCIAELAADSAAAVLNKAPAG